jgi:transcriptional regulator with PAS, ATPase and Fis domain
VAVNCAAIPQGLLESELFGYEEGAFTGAKKRREAGACLSWPRAGTIFMDEIGEISPEIQTRC